MHGQKAIQDVPLKRSVLQFVWRPLQTRTLTKTQRWKFKCGRCVWMYLVLLCEKTWQLSNTLYRFLKRYRAMWRKVVFFMLTRFQNETNLASRTCSRNELSKTSTHILWFIGSIPLFFNAHVTHLRQKTRWNKHDRLLPRVCAPYESFPTSGKLGTSSHWRHTIDFCPSRIVSGFPTNKKPSNVKTVIVNWWVVTQNCVADGL